MGRPRKHKTTFPAYVRVRHGSYQYQDKKLCRVEEGEARMYEKLAELKRGQLDVTMLPAAVAVFKLDYLQTLSPSARKEHDRLLTVFSDEFTEYRVDQVSPVDIRRSIRNLYAGKLAAAKHYKSRIARFFRWCVEEAGLRTDNPAREVVQEIMRRHVRDHRHHCFDYRRQQLQIKFHVAPPFVGLSGRPWFSPSAG